MVVSENIRVIKWTESVFFEVVGGQSQGFVVGSWLLFTLVESESVKDLFVYGRNESRVIGGTVISALNQALLQGAHSRLVLILRYVVWEGRRVQRGKLS